MADEDALSYLKDRIKADAGSNRRSRATNTPRDATPDTYMGASAIIDGDEVEESTSVQPLMGEGGEGGDMSIRRRRVRKSSRSRTAGTAAVDPDFMNKILSGLRASSQPSGTAKVNDDEVVLQSPSVSSPIPEEAAETTMPTAVSAAASPVPAPARSSLRDVAAAAAAPSASHSSEEKELLAELEATKAKLEDVEDRLEDYDLLCENLLSGQTPEARSLAKYVGELLDKLDDAEETREKQASQMTLLQSTQGELTQAAKHSDLAKEEIWLLREDLEQMQAQLEEQRALNVRLQEQADETGGSAADQQRTTRLEAQLKSKDEEIEELKRKLLSMPSEPSGGLAEDEIFAKAEEDLKLMEELIQEQEEFMNKMEEEMERALEDMPPSLREQFIKERDRIMQENAGSLSKLGSLAAEPAPLSKATEPSSVQTTDTAAGTADSLAEGDGSSVSAHSSEQE